MSTPFHAKYFAHELSRHHNAGSVQRISQSLFDACVDLNPHQIEAALFALRSPLSKGAILADEVGLGKTIEAGLLLTQYWAERKRKMIIICPAALRKQWSNELNEKFNLPNMVIDAKIYNEIKRKGRSNPFDQDRIVICSIHFAARYATKIRTVLWDLAVIDEAHKLRNVFRPKNKMAHSIKWALDDSKKVLLTATPIQNSLMELYGLSTLIDEQIFGDAEAFRSQFINKNEDFFELKQRLSQFCQRTLRNNVTEFIRYTNRRSFTLPYEINDQEQHLYDRISEFISQEDTYSIPFGQRHLMTLILRKILASSTYAISETLKTMRNRLEALKNGVELEIKEFDHFLSNDEIEDEYLEEYYDELDRSSQRKEIDIEQLNDEIATLNDLINLASQLQVDTKALSLLKALDIGFDELKKMKAANKAIIFTESRRTQDFLYKFLSEKGFENRVVLFNGSNNDDFSKELYARWIIKHKDTGQLSGSKPVDMRAAIVDYFRNTADIMIATEAAAEGINLQFCSLLINYDLPWNPQRIEQRIGRCHRYGQKHDVVVMNFLNKRNETDCRVYELLEQKFNLFDGVFGASDEILGNLESGVEFERRILNIYQTCRNPHEIDTAFEQLQLEMEDVIQEKMNDTKQLLLEHFDQDVHERLKINLDETRAQLDHFGFIFWELTKFILNNVGDFNETNLEFDLLKSPIDSVEPGQYHMISKNKTNTPGPSLYRLTHPLGEFVISAGKNQSAQPTQVYFDISNHPTNITPVKKLKGKSGWMTFQMLTIDSFEPEEYLIFAGQTDSGRKLDQELCEKMFLCRGATGKSVEIKETTRANLQKLIETIKEEHVKESIDLNSTFFNQECDKIDQWAEDMIIGIEKELETIKREIRQKSRQARLWRDAVEQHRFQVEIKKLETQKMQLREKLFAMEDELMEKRDDLIDKLGKRLTHDYDLKELFTIRWTVI